MVNYQDYITIDSNKRFGKLIIIGTRIGVYDVLNWLANGMNNDEIIEDFPELNNTRIQACLAYVATRENRLRIYHEPKEAVA